MIKKFFFLFFLVVSVSFCYAGDSDRPLVEIVSESNATMVKNDNVKLDSIEIYKELIAKEDKEASYGSHIVGIVFGGLICAAGTALVVGGISTLDDKSDDVIDEVVTHGAGAAMIFWSFPFYLLGIPILAYNIYQYNVHKNHAIKRDEYLDALTRYYLKKQLGEDGVQLILVPAVDLVGARIGANAILRF